MNSHPVRCSLPACLALLFLSTVFEIAYSASLFRSPRPHILQTEITESNWRTHPRIKEIRQIVRAINRGLSKNSFKISRKEFDCGEGGDVRRVARDSRGAVTWYEDYSEGQDSSSDFNYYYDSTGHLRFVIAFARAANGTREKLRLYFNESGKRIWQNRILQGPGCPGCFSAYYDSDEAIAFNPKQAFSGDQGCKEIKLKPTNERSP
jgi:hypothetical protein